MKLRRFQTTAAMAAAVTLVLAACGADPAATTSDSGAATPTDTTSQPPESEAPEAQTIKIGVSGSFSGATAFYGQEAERGVRLAVAELNDEGGPYEYEVVTADDECTPDGGASAFGNLMDVEEVDVIIGSPCSGAALGGMPLLPDGQVPALAVSATNPAITEQAGAGGNEYMWRMNIGDDVMARVWAQYIADQGITRIATIAVNNDFGRGGVEAYKAQFPEHDVEVVAEEYYEQGGGEFRAQLTQIGDSGAEAMLIIGAHQDGAVMIRQLRELALDIDVFARGDLVSSGFQEVAGDPNLGDGMLEANNWDSTYEAYPELADAYRAEHDSDPLSYAVQAYLGTMVIAQAAEAGGAGSEGIQAGLAEVSWDSPIGPIEFDDNHQAHHDMFILGFVDGEIVLIDRVATAE